jgi:hypothetical protein
MNIAEQEALRKRLVKAIDSKRVDPSMEFASELLQEFFPFYYMSKERTEKAEREYKLGQAMPATQVNKPSEDRAPNGFYDY